MLGCTDGHQDSLILGSEQTSVGEACGNCPGSHAKTPACDPPQLRVECYGHALCLAGCMVEAVPASPSAVRVSARIPG